MMQLSLNKLTSDKNDTMTRIKLAHSQDKVLAACNITDQVLIIWDVCVEVEEGIF